MSSFFRSKLARELAAILKQRWGGRAPFSALHLGEPEPIRDDLEYFTDRHSKQMKLAAGALVPAARDAHLKMASHYRAKASEALRTAMRHNRDALHLSLLDLPTERNADLDALIAHEGEPIRAPYVERS